MRKTIFIAVALAAVTAMAGATLAAQASTGSAKASAMSTSEPTTEWH